ncbi:DUF4439 domain-containing protein [Sinomonas sp. JGH33]|uniref:DUF4439 domain-containing protein n=1 Tax=Sinomonas terricola TaxID=3110330 RepID=A0ABU5T4K4_9MICC|nr:DUF4439 domain-containing protein [Sinomonas sp. JGH33]MEA5454590.1 DUF4439 domain-containing protein [Sinomonas sp. JGH33]
MTSTTAPTDPSPEEGPSSPDAPGHDGPVDPGSADSEAGEAQSAADPEVSEAHDDGDADPAPGAGAAEDPASRDEPDQDAPAEPSSAGTEAGEAQAAADPEVSEAHDDGDTTEPHPAGEDPASSGEPEGKNGIEEAIDADAEIDDAALQPDTPPQADALAEAEIDMPSDDEHVDAEPTDAQADAQGLVDEAEQPAREPAETVADTSAEDEEDTEDSEAEGPGGEEPGGEEPAAAPTDVHVAEATEADELTDQPAGDELVTKPDDESVAEALAEPEPEPEPEPEAEPELAAEPEPDASAEPETEPAAFEEAPAETGAEAEPAPAAADSPPAAATRAETLAAASPSRPRRAWPFWALGAATLAVGIGSATFVSLQTVAPTGPSKSEIALSHAQSEAAQLAGLARSASQGANPRVQSALGATALVLDRQVGVLSTRDTGSSSGSGPTVGRTGTTDLRTTSPAASAADVVSRLRASAESRLADLPEVDGPTATVLASLAAGQSLQADGLAGAAGLASPPQAPSPAPSAGASPSVSSPPAAQASASASACATPTAAQSPAPSSPPSPGTPLSFGGALASVERAETAAAYVLEAALAHTAASSADAAARERALDAHRRQLDGVDVIAASSCLALPPRDAGFAVPADFATNPNPTLAAVAQSAEESWAELVGAAPGQRRRDAAEGLVAASRLAGDAVAFPGLPAAEQTVKQASAQATGQPTAQPTSQ